MTEHDPPDSKRRSSVFPDIFKRAVEMGVERTPENLKNFVNELKLPKEIAHYVFAQIDETKNGLFRVVAKEIRDFLEHTNFSGELQKVLTTVQFEVNTTIRFSPNKSPSPSSAPNDDKEGADENDADSAKSSTSPEEKAGGAASMPMPQVKTQVHVRRDERDKKKRPR